MPPSKPWIFICPSSRGIGQALTRYILQQTAHSSIPILATTRHSDPSSTKAALLSDLSSACCSSTSGLSERLAVIRCDVTDEQSIISAAQHANELFPRDTHHLHLACAMPGVLLGLEKSPMQVEAGSFMESYRVNALGPLLLAKHFFEFLPTRSTVMEHTNQGNVTADNESSEACRTTLLNLPKHATWINMSARVGSTTDNRSGGWFSYRASKAAVNSITKSLDIHLRMRAGNNAMAVSYHPGTVKTGLSQRFWGSVPEEKLFSPEYAAGRMVDVMCRLGMEQRGRCWDWAGKEIPP